MRKTKVMKRNIHPGRIFSQDTPILQLRVILGSIEGHLSNMVAGIASEKSMNRALDNMQEAKAIVEAIGKGEDPHTWEKDG